MKGLIWFRHDLRISDNPALISLSKQCSQALMLFVIDPNWFKTNNLQARHMGYVREIFLLQTLRELDLDLKKYQQKLVVKVGDPLEIIPELCKKHGIDFVTLTDHPNVQEQNQAKYLQQKLPSRVQICASHTLFLKHQLSFNKANFPASEELFCAHVIKHNLLPCIPISAPDSLPKALRENNDDWRNDHFFQPLSYYHGGEDAGLMRLKEFFWKTSGLQRYSEFLNDIEGIQSHSRFSAWLVNGCISVRSVAAELDKYEYRNGSDKSSKAMYLALIRREYYQWKLGFLNKKPSAFNVKAKAVALKEKQQESYQNWQQGKTAFPIVNACMKQLNHVGYLSNLGRKIVANCLVHELEIDWRYGAAYFEQQLIDFDPAINYFNWLKLVEANENREKHFHHNVEQYIRDHDPEGKFIARWDRVIDKVLLRY